MKEYHKNLGKYTPNLLGKKGYVVVVVVVVVYLEIIYGQRCREDLAHALNK